MKTQQDHKVRIVALDNLSAMCVSASGWTHRYEISKVSRSRVHVEYSNPDEYGAESPVTAVFPCFPSTFPGDETNPRVVLDCVRVFGGRNEHDREAGWQAIDASIVSAPSLWRSTSSSTQWLTRADIDQTDRYICPDGSVRTVDRNHPYTDDRFAAFEVTNETTADFFERIGGSRRWAFFPWSEVKPVKEV